MSFISRSNLIMLMDMIASSHMWIFEHAMRPDLVMRRMKLPVWEDLVMRRMGLTLWARAFGDWRWSDCHVVHAEIVSAMPPRLHELCVEIVCAMQCYELVLVFFAEIAHGLCRDHDAHLRDR